MYIIFMLNLLFSIIFFIKPFHHANTVFTEASLALTFSASFSLPLCRGWRWEEV